MRRIHEAFCDQKQTKDKGVGGQRLTDVQADVQGFSPQFWYGTGRCMGDKAPV